MYHCRHLVVDKSCGLDLAGGQTLEGVGPHCAVAHAREKLDSILACLRPGMLEHYN